jgi:hypothetical protein
MKSIELARDTGLHYQPDGSRENSGFNVGKAPTSVDPLRRIGMESGALSTRDATALSQSTVDRSFSKGSLDFAEFVRAPVSKFDDIAKISIGSADDNPSAVVSCALTARRAFLHSLFSSA